jgi:hypothetical protein
MLVAEVVAEMGYGGEVRSLRDEVRRLMAEG